MKEQPISRRAGEFQVACTGREGMGSVGGDECVMKMSHNVAFMGMRG